MAWGAREVWVRSLAQEVPSASGAAMKKEKTEYKSGFQEFLLWCKGIRGISAEPGLKSDTVGERIQCYDSCGVGPNNGGLDLSPDPGIPYAMWWL